MSPAAVYAPTSARRGRQARQAARRAPPPPAPAYLTRRLPLYQMHGDEALALLETNADRILAEIGIDFIDDEALAHVSVEDLVEVNVPAAAARRILSK